MRGIFISARAATGVLLIASSVVLSCKLILSSVVATVSNKRRICSFTNRGDRTVNNQIANPTTKLLEDWNMRNRSCVRKSGETSMIASRTIFMPMPTNMGVEPIKPNEVKIA